MMNKKVGSERVRRNQLNLVGREAGDEVVVEGKRKSQRKKRADAVD